MSRGDYLIALNAALAKANLKSHMVKGDRMSEVAMHLPTEVLRAVVKKEVMYEKNDPDGFYKDVEGAVAFHMGWIQACDDELTDRILTDNAN